MSGCVISEEWMDGAWCQKVVVLGVSLEIPAIFGVYAPDYMSLFKMKTPSLFALFPQVALSITSR